MDIYQGSFEDISDISFISMEFNCGLGFASETSKRPFLSVVVLVQSQQVLSLMPRVPTKLFSDDIYVDLLSDIWVLSGKRKINNEKFCFKINVIVRIEHFK